MRKGDLQDLERNYRSRCLSTYVTRSLTLALLSYLLMYLNIMAYAQGGQVFPTEKSISLTIWGAGLSMRSDQGKRWDTQSPPDGLVRVYLGDRLITQSNVKRDTLQPMWALTVGPILERRFYEGPLVIQVVDQDLLGEELIEELLIPMPKAIEVARVLKLEGKYLKPLIYQWVDTTPPTPKASDRLSLKESRFVPNDAERTSKRSTRELDDKVDLEEQRRAERMQRQRSAKKVSRAASLYRSYLKAQFSGDQLQAHRILLRLAMKYSNTRHGRKARRIMLLDGR